MIELRWLIKNGWDGPERVLQCRTFEPRGFDDDGVPHYNGDPSNWSKWEDVPTVREGE